MLLNVKSKRFFVTLPDGVRICCLKEMKENAVTDKYLILLHGRLHTKTRGPISSIRDKLPFHCISIDARGMGESDGMTGYSNAQEEVQDLAFLMSHLSTALNLGILGIIGHSKGAVVALTYASQFQLPSPLFIISISARYDSSNLLTTFRFSKEQDEELEKNGSFVWMNYRIGSEESGRLDRRPYVVTKEAIEAHRERKLDCITNLPRSVHALVMHGKSDGTVPFQQSVKIDQIITESSQACSDLILLEGISHNWSEEGQPELLANVVSGWLQARISLKAAKVTELIDHLGKDREKLINRNEKGLE